MNTNLKIAFETTVNELTVKHFWLKNEIIQVGICNHGARITHFIVSKNNIETDICLGFNSIEDYTSKENEFYYGVTVGRFANRIENAEFQLNDKTYQLEANNGGNSLHSGSHAFHNKVWEIEKSDERSVTLKVLSPAGEGGFPGNLSCQVCFTLTDENELIINYSAKTDQDTVVNLTNHSYFNLNGEGKGPILNHSFRINADEFVPIKKNCTPKGDFENVEETPFDFRTAKTISEDIQQNDEQLEFGNGYDHSFAINRSEILNFAASAKGDESGITLEVYTTQPGMQFYTGNYLSGDIGKSGLPYLPRTAFCFETQHHPDSPNHPNFPTTVLKAGERFNSTTVFKVS